MDLICAKCGEPWDYSFVESEFSELEKEMFYAGDGCPSCLYKKASEEILQEIREEIQIVNTMLGDDKDALAAEHQNIIDKQGGNE